MSGILAPRSYGGTSYERTLVPQGATIGANATIVAGATLGRYAFIAAGAVVRGEIPDYALMAGVPAVRKGWMSRHGHHLPPADAEGLMTCPESGWRYSEIEPGVLHVLIGLKTDRWNSPADPTWTRPSKSSTRASGRITAMIATTTRQSTPVPLLNLKAQYATIRDEVRAAIDRVLEAQIFILGPEVEALDGSRRLLPCTHERRGFVGHRRDPGRAYGHRGRARLRGDYDAVHLFRDGGCISRLGASPVFVDIHPETYNIDPEHIAAAITEHTRAIIPVHLFGQVADMDAIKAVANSGLVVIEDAAQAIGAKYKGRGAGSIGHLGCLSFFPSKNLGAFGDGGMVVTNNPDLADRIKLLPNHGYRPKYHNKVVGGNFRLDSIQAAVLRVKLKYLDGWTESRRRNAETYRRLLREAGLVLDGWDGGPLDGRGGFVLPHDAGYGHHIYNQFIIPADRRDELMAHLKDYKIGTEVYYPVPMHLQECFAGLGYDLGTTRPVNGRRTRRFQCPSIRS